MSINYRLRRIEDELIRPHEDRPLSVPEEWLTLALSGLEPPIETLSNAELRAWKETVEMADSVPRVRR
jgi:hypothetical protein